MDISMQRATRGETVFSPYPILIAKYLNPGQFAVEPQSIHDDLQGGLPGSSFAALLRSHFPSTKQELAAPRPILHHEVTSPNIPRNGMVAPSERKRTIA
jgi:hypothetical protein